MSDLGKTILFLAVAGVLAGAAYFSQPRASRDASSFVEDREPFFKIDPEKIKGLEITAYDPDLGATKTFSVKLENGAWIIPSLNNYPADAAERMKKTAGSVLGLMKDSVVSDDSETHKEYGVVDPLDKSGNAESWGKRIKLSDEQGNVLADLIIGKDVNKGSSDAGSFKFVRLADKPRVYAVDCGNLDLSTTFTDWVKPELITDSEWNFERIKRTEYHQNPQTRAITSDVPVDLLKVENKWTLQGLQEGQETNEDTARDFAQAVTDLKIVGVRQKPPGLQGNLRTLADKIQAQVAIDEMADRGFFSLSDGRIVSPDGDITVQTKEGIVYTLRLGGVFLGKREEVEAGSKDEKAVEDVPQPAEGEKRPPEMQENRFLLVSVAFDESLIPAVEPPPGVQIEPAPTEPAKAEPTEQAPVDPKQPPAEAPESDEPKTQEAAEPPAEPAPPAEPPKESPDGLQNVVLQEEEPAPVAADEPPAPAADTPPVDTSPADKPDAERAADPPPAEQESKPAEEPTPDPAEEAKKAAEQEAQQKAAMEKAKYEQEKAERDRKIESGRKQAQELQARFDQWFYVVSNEQAKKLLVKREDFIKVPEPEKDAAEENPATDPPSENAATPEPSAPEAAEEKPMDEASPAKDDEPQAEAPKAESPEKTDTEAQPAEAAPE